MPRPTTPEPAPYNISADSRPYIQIRSENFTARTDLRNGTNQVDRVYVENLRLGQTFVTDYDQVAELIALFMRFSTMMPEPNTEAVPALPTTDAFAEDEDYE